MEGSVVRARSVALAAVLLLLQLPAERARGADGECSALIVDETMLPVSGYLVSQACLEAYGPWSEADLDACQGGLSWTTLDASDFDDEEEYTLLVCEASSVFLVHRNRHEEVATSWGRLKTLFR